MRGEGREEEEEEEEEATQKRNLLAHAQWVLLIVFSLSSLSHSLFLSPPLLPNPQFFPTESSAKDKHRS